MGDKEGEILKSFTNLKIFWNCKKKFCLSKQSSILYPTGSSIFNCERINGTEPDSQQYLSHLYLTNKDEDETSFFQFYPFSSLNLLLKSASHNMEENQQLQGFNCPIEKHENLVLH